MTAPPPNAAPVPLIIHGAAGRIGKRLIALAAEQPEKFQIIAAIDRADSPELGHDAGRLAGVAELGIKLTVELPRISRPAVVIDFSIPAATRTLIPQCVKQNLPALICTTGLTAADQTKINAAAGKIPILQTTNTSLGVNLMMRLVGQMARQLGPDYDIELVEAHHNQKKDSPSGTAESLLESLLKATGKGPEAVTHGRHGAETRRVPGTIGVHAVRMGDVVGEHTVHFSTHGERLELKHVATTRDTFAHGALRAAAWLFHQKPGRYTMADVLGI